MKLSWGLCTDLLAFLESDYNLYNPTLIQAHIPLGLN
jgi:hypothetical protein